MRLSEYVKEYRAKHRISQRQLCEMCGLSHNYIFLIEREINPKTGKEIVPTIDALNKLAKGMGVTLTHLLKSVDNMPININGTGSIELIADSDLHERLAKAVNSLNEHGLMKIIELAEDLLQLDKYKKE